MLQVIPQLNKKLALIKETCPVKGPNLKSIFYNQINFCLSNQASQYYYSLTECYQEGKQHIHLNRPQIRTSCAALLHQIKLLEKENQATHYEMHCFIFKQKTITIKKNYSRSFWNIPRLRLSEVSDGWEDPTFAFEEEGPAEGLLILFSSECNRKQNKITIWNHLNWYLNDNI